MTYSPRIHIERWTRSSVTSAILSAAVLVALAAGPAFCGANVLDKLTTLFVYIIIGVVWNALAGYGGLVSIGQQAFLGLGGYAAIRLTDAGIDVYLAIALAALLVGAVSLPLSTFMLQLRDGEFAIGMWVVAALTHLIVNLDPLIHGETGTSLIALNAYPAALRRAYTYWAALGGMCVVLGAFFAILRSPLGASLQAIRDNETAAASLGVKVMPAKRLLFVLSAAGVALAGALWLASTVTFQPGSFFGSQWTAYMIFIVLVGGLGTFEGPILGAVLFSAIESWFGGTGVWYLIGLGGTSLAFALFLPKGLWGVVEQRFGVRLLPVGRWLRVSTMSGARVDARPFAATGSEVDG